MASYNGNGDAVMKIGLTLGKFAPLHRGHQLVIETALSEMDHVIALIYDVPDVTDIPLSVRANWIKRLYPTVEVLEAWDGPLQVSNAPEVTAMHDAYLKKRFAGRTISHFYSSELYGEHVSAALNATDRRVDDQRQAIDISATQIRLDSYAMRSYLDPIVYRDHLTHVVFLGAPSTGKSTVAEAISRRLRTVWVPEYGREYWEMHQVARKLTLEQLFEIGDGHRDREDAVVSSANRYLFIDTDASTTRNFSMYYHDRCDERLEQMVRETRERYDLFFLCEPDFPFDDTWDRSGEVSREVFQRRIESDLIARRIPFIRLGGSIECRCETIEKVLATHRKWH